MSVFRRSWAAGPPVGMEVERKDVGPEELVVSRTDNGSVLVAVDGNAKGWDALEWAAAEAAARQCTLRVVHVVDPSPPLLGDYMGGFVGDWDSGVLDAGKFVLEEAVQRALAVAPGLSIATRLHEGPTATAVVMEGRRDALIVVGRGHKGGRLTTFARSASLQIARHAVVPVVVVELSDTRTRGPSSRRVVVSVDRTAEPLAVLEFGFRAALRRGIGITVLHASGNSRPTEMADRMGDGMSTERIDWQRALRTCRQTFPDVSVRQRLAGGPVVPALLAESEGAALVVIGSEQRGGLQGFLSESFEGNISRLAHSPVAIVGCRQ